MLLLGLKKLVIFKFTFYFLIYKKAVGLRPSFEVGIHLWLYFIIFCGKFIILTITRKKSLNSMRLEASK